MIFSTIDGTKTVHEGDRLIVKLDEGTLVHFVTLSTWDEGTAEVYTDCGIKYVDIPNGVLTDHNAVMVYAVKQHGDVFTKHCADFEVEA